jgi:hypothetical protein
MALQFRPEFRRRQDLVLEPVFTPEGGVLSIPIPVNGREKPVKKFLGEKATIVMNIKLDDPETSRQIPALRTVKQEYMRPPKNIYSKYLTPSAQLVESYADKGLQAICFPTDQGDYEPDDSMTVRIKVGDSNSTVMLACSTTMWPSYSYYHISCNNAMAPLNIQPHGWGVAWHVTFMHESRHVWSFLQKIFTSSGVLEICTCVRIRTHVHCLRAFTYIFMYTVYIFRTYMNVQIRVCAHAWNTTHECMCLRASMELYQRTSTHACNHARMRLYLSLSLSLFLSVRTYIHTCSFHQVAQQFGLQSSTKGPVVVADKTDGKLLARLNNCHTHTYIIYICAYVFEGNSKVCLCARIHAYKYV